MNKSDKGHFFRLGLRDGLPIALGYFTVSLSLGIALAKAGLTPFEGGLMSLTNMTSAGEFASITVITAGESVFVMAVLELVINARYLLMSCALTQRLDSRVTTPTRLLLGLTITDEIFGVTVGREEPYIEPLYSLGAFAVATPGWTLGTVCGAVMGNVLPGRVVAALGVALYAMLIAVVIPAAKRDRIVAGSVLAAMVCSLVWEQFPPLTAIPGGGGMKIILLTVLLSALAALFFPVDRAANDAPGGERGAAP
jgi:predicted branched-subunit amino acid permease